MYYTYFDCTVKYNSYTDVHLLAIVYIPSTYLGYTIEYLYSALCCFADFEREYEVGKSKIMHISWYMEFEISYLSLTCSIFPHFLSKGTEITFWNQCLPKGLKLSFQ